MYNTIISIIYICVCVIFFTVYVCLSVLLFTISKHAYSIILFSPHCTVILYVILCTTERVSLGIRYPCIVNNIYIYFTV